MRRAFLLALVALALVATACSDDDEPTTVGADDDEPAAEASGPPVIGDHWHAAVGFSRCGEWLEDQADAEGHGLGIHSHGDGLIHIHPFDEEATGDNAVLGLFLDTVGAEVDDEGLHLATGEDLPFSGECDGEPAELRVVRWETADAATPEVTTVRTADDLLDVALRPDGLVLAIAFTADEQLDQPPSVANVARPADTAAADVPHVPGSIPDRDDVLAFAPVLWSGAGPCSDTAVEGDDECFELGPVAVDQGGVESADARVMPSGQWAIELVLTEAGIGDFNEAASACFGQSDRCPTGRIAIVLRSKVISAPTVQAERFERDAIVISAEFTEREAKDLAAAIRS